MATDLQYREGLTDTQKNQLVTRLDRIKAGSAITDTDKSNFNYGLGSSWESYLGQNLNYDGLGKTPTPATPTPQPDPTQAFMNGLAGANVQNQAQLTEQQKRLLESQKLMKDAQMLQGTNPDQTAYDQRMIQLEEAYKGTMGKGEAYKQQLEQAGVPEAQKQLADLNILMAQQQASFQQGMLDTEGKVIPMRFITGQQAQMQKQYAITAGNTAMMAQALQGNISMAKQTAMDTVNLEYADREAELNMQKQMLELNYDKLTRSEKRRADELNFMLQREEARIAEEKATQQSKYDLAIQAFENGADEATARKIMNSKDIGSAIMSAGAYLSDMANRVSSGAPVKIGTDGQGKDIFYMDGYGVVTGDELLGKIGGGPDDIILQSFDQEAYDYAEAIRDGQYKLDQIKDDDLRTRVMTAQKMLPPSPKAISNAESMIASLKSLYNPETGEQHGGMNAAVGPAGTGFFSRTWISEPFKEQNRTAFLGIANQIVSKKALDELISAKSQGATFGALSDREMDILKSAATKLGSWEIKDKDGRVKGYKTTEENVRKAIEDMIKDYDALLKEAKDPLNLTKVGGDTNTAILNKLSTVKSGEKGGQCGRFVNKLTGYKLGLGDSYQSKISKMDPSIRFPEPGMVFVTPYKDTGHTGFIVAVNNNGTVTVKDSNYGLDEKVRVRTMPITKITGLARV